MAQQLLEPYIITPNKKTQYTHTPPRKWTPTEIKHLQSLIQQGYTNKQISKILQRTHTSISIKRKRLSKENNTHQYNKDHYQEKYNANNDFLKYIQPRNVLDIYNGGNTQYTEYNPCTNDIDEQVNSMYHEDAYKFILQQYLTERSYDLIDLDPYGSAYDCFDIAMKIINTQTPLHRGGGTYDNTW